MGKCRACGSVAKYNSQAHRYTCECGHTWVVLPTKKKCWHCGEPYDEYRQGDPSGCSKCHRTFVD